MKERFIDGEDGAWFVYAAVDGDERLDDVDQQGSARTQYYGFRESELECGMAAAWSCEFMQEKERRGFSLP